MKVRTIVTAVMIAVFAVFCQSSSANAALLTVSGTNHTQVQGPGNLYSLSAVLMDGESGRVLYGKESTAARPMASTTKIMTCILALENSDGDDYVEVSEKAAAQPEVKLGMKAGEQYYMEDLLYSLMLKSHNDTAVAVAEHVGGTVEHFAQMMNRKAEEIGCRDTYFITPNGLDASDENGIHHTTAEDLAQIMRYAIQNEVFLKITQTRSYSFSDLKKKRQFSIQNANALFDMTDGVISGKTGFTADAGYCYVCACEKEGKLFIVALLGCGWPNNKSYKWSDTRKLLEYGNENYFYTTYWKNPILQSVPVKNAVDGDVHGTIMAQGICQVSEEDRNREILLGKNERITYTVEMEKSLEAPVQKGQKIGEIVYYLEGQKFCSYPVIAEKNIEKLTYQWCVEQVFHNYFH